MRVRTSKSKLGLRFYIIKTYYDTKGIERTITVEKLGSEQEIREKTGRDPMEWAKERAAFLTQQEKAENHDVSFTLSPAKLITKNYQYTFQVGYLFLQKIFYELGMDRICTSIQKNADSGSPLQSRHLRVFPKTPTAAGLRSSPDVSGFGCSCGQL